MYYSEEIQKFDTALHYQEQGLKIKLDSINGDDPLLATSFLRTGTLYKKLGNDIKALEYDKTSFEMRERLFTGDHPVIAESLQSLGVSYTRLGDDNKALEYY